jgi:membrane-associated phospholipid phosphatase
VVVLVATSRLVLGAHHLVDVLAGMAVGLCWLALCGLGQYLASRGRVAKD